MRLRFLKSYIFDRDQRWLPLIFCLILLRFALVPIGMTWGLSSPWSWLDIAFDGKELLNFLQELLALAILVYFFEHLAKGDEQRAFARKSLNDVLRNGLFEPGSSRADLEKMKNAMILLSNEDAAELKHYSARISDRPYDELSEDEKEVVERILSILRKYHLPSR